MIARALFVVLMLLALVAIVAIAALGVADGLEDGPS